MAGSKIDRIKAHLAMAEYPMEHYKQNFKNADEKVKYFAKKEAAGELQSFLKPRMEEASTLLSQLKALKPGAAVPGAAAPVAVPSPKANAATVRKTASNAPVAALTREELIERAKKFAEAKRLARGAEPAVAAPVPAPAAVAAPVAKPAARTREELIEIGKKFAESRRLARGVVAAPKPNARPTTNLRIKIPKGTQRKKSNRGAPRASASRGRSESPKRLTTRKRSASPKPSVSPKRSASSKRSARSKRSVSPTSVRPLRPLEINEYLNTAFEETQKTIPPLYNPFTGERFGPSNRPVDEIERAYMMLRKVRSNTVRRASLLRAKAARASKTSKTVKASNKPAISRPSRLTRPNVEPFAPPYLSKAPYANPYKPALSPVMETNENSNSNSNSR